MAGIYLHIPFCKKRCIYCDFYSTTCIAQQMDYVEALIREIKMRKDYLSSNGSIPVIDTIYLGGGTPSTLSHEHLEKIFDTIFSTYQVSKKAEITMEANPDDLTGKDALRISDLPINRISLGVQTFNDKQLKLLNRRHSGCQAIKAIEKCKADGIENISIDLIYGLPEQTLSDWEEEIKTAISLDIQHLSAYALIYEEGTPLWNMRREQLVKEVEDDVSLSMFNSLIDRLSLSGFEHYEISNFARQGYRSRHNSSYWRGIPYLGCGASAHSYDGNNRHWNVADLNVYLQEVNRCTPPLDETNATWMETEVLSVHEKYNDCIITSLRTSDGLDLSRIQSAFGQQFTDYCLRMAQKHIQNGLLEHIKKDEQSPLGLLKLTRQGIFVSDGVMSDLLSIED